jgi:mRNA interferase HicA
LRRASYAMPTRPRVDSPGVVRPKIVMEYATFRKWLAEHGCRFDAQSEKRGEGHGTVTVHRGGRIAELPLVGASHNLDPRSHSALIGPNSPETGGPRLRPPQLAILKNAGAMSALGTKRTC